MKNTPIALLVYPFFLLGCSDGTNLVGSNPDLASIATADMAPSTPDMSLPADLSQGPDLAVATPLGTPIVATMNQWSWVDFPDSFCDDGSTTGIGLDLGASKNLLVFLNGGGACWDALTCYTLNTAVHGPFGKPQFDKFAGAGLSGTVFDRGEPKNPFKDWSFVFVPYCTGDVHAGDNIAMYADGNGGMKAYHHTGHANIMAYLKRLAATFPALDRLVVSGSSAGGFGTAMNYDSFRRYWPTTKAYLLDDSGPPLEGNSVPAFERTAWYKSWALGKLLDPLCGMACQSDLSALVKVLGAKYPADRMALLSSLQDQTIRSYFQLQPADFQAALLLMAKDLFEPSPNGRYFFVAGQTHTMLGAVPKFTSGGVTLWDWLTQLVTDDAGWKSLKP